MTEKLVNFLMEVKFLEKFDFQAKQLGVTRSKFLRVAMEKLMEQYDPTFKGKTELKVNTPKGIQFVFEDIKAQGSALLNLATGNQNRIDALETDNATANNKLRNIENRLIALEADNVTAWSAIRNLQLRVTTLEKQ